VLDPLTLVGLVGAIVTVALALHFTPLSDLRVQQVTAWLVAALFAGSVVLSATNGLYLLFLLPGVFNGEDFRPYFYLLELLVGLTLARGLAAHIMARRRLAFPHAPFVLLFLASTVVALPLNLRETWLHLQVTPWTAWLGELRQSDHLSHLFTVRLILNVATGIGIYVLAANERWTRAAVLRLALAATVVYVGITGVGLFFHWFTEPVWRTFLTLFLTGPYTGGFVGLGSNVSFFAQYALPCLPLVVLVALGYRGWRRWLALGALLVSAYTVLATHQRGATLALILEVGLLLGVGWTLARDPAFARVGRATIAAAGLVTLLAALLLHFTPLRSWAVETFANLVLERGEAVRRQTLRVAGQMLSDHPLLGVGSGRFAHFFPRHSLPSDVASQLFVFEPGWSTHNLYVQLAAEQGLVGLASFLLMVGAVVVPIVRSQRRLAEDRPTVLLLLVSLAAWLIYGLLYYTFLLRAQQLFFWITLGLLVSLTAAVAPPVRLPRRWWKAGGLALLALLALRVHEVASWPLPPGLAQGVHREWEYWADPGGARWTRGGAVLNPRVEGTVMVLPLAFPVGHLTPRPQRAWVSVDGAPAREVVFDRPGWQVLEFPVDKPLGSTVLVRIRVAYTVAPNQLGLSADARQLGVMIRPVRWRGDEAHFQDPAWPRPAPVPARRAAR
jgi:O-antigen ligase